MSAEMFAITVLAGPTAAGKTRAAIEWAVQCGGEVLSCDSLLFYRGMDIGTAKPDRHERRGVPHHGIDLVDLDEMFSVARYIDYAWDIVRDCEQRGVPLIVTGGCGFYLKAFFAPVVDGIVVADEVRKQVDQWYQTEGLNGLVTRLQALNPDGLGSLDSRNPRRVVAALGRCLSSGKSLREQREAFAACKVPFARWQRQLECVDCDRDALIERVTVRAREMLAAGLIDEVRSLQSKGLRNNPVARQAIGYREVLAWMDAGESAGDLPDLERQIVRNTLRLVKKQRNWLRNQLPAPGSYAATP